MARFPSYTPKPQDEYVKFGIRAERGDEGADVALVRDEKIRRVRLDQTRV